MLFVKVNERRLIHQPARFIANWLACFRKLIIEFYDTLATVLKVGYDVSDGY